MKTTIAIVACAALGLVVGCGDELADGSFDTVDSTEEAALDNQPDFGDGSACHVPDEGIGGGTRDGAWCCGTATCDDADTCGSDFGEPVKTCVDCHYYECIPGDEMPPEERDPTPPRWRGWVYTPPITGGVYAP